MSFAVTGLCKSFSGNSVLDHVDLTVEDGEIHALLGANGAGKSTLIKCISGAHYPDSGEIVVGNVRYDILTPKSAKNAGVCVVYQDLSLADSLDIADNIFLGRELRIGSFIRRKQQRKEVRQWLMQLGVDLSPRASLSEISSAQLQLVEIIKALRGSPRILILDEPTASLTDAEAEQLIEHLRLLKQKGIPILYVTHRLGEVFALADRVSVIRGGKVVLSEATSETDEESLVTAIVGRSLEALPAVGGKHGKNSAKPSVFQAHNLLSPGIGPIEIEVGNGEILGVYGLTGSGRTELLETIFGSQRLYSGDMVLNSKRVTASNPAQAVAQGIALVPSDRRRKSILASMSASDNTLLPRFSMISDLGIRRKAIEAQRFEDVAERLDLQPPRAEQQAQRFSGGNQQKLVIGRWMQKGDNAKLLLMDEPTQGVDVGARKDLYNALQDFVSSGDRAAIVTSSEPSELMRLADRVIVLCGGLISAELKGAAITETTLLKAAQQRPERDLRG